MRSGGIHCLLLVDVSQNLAFCAYIYTSSVASVGSASTFQTSLLQVPYAPSVLLAGIAMIQFLIFNVLHLLHEKPLTKEVEECLNARECATTTGSRTSFVVASTSLNLPLISCADVRQIFLAPNPLMNGEGTGGATSGRTTQK